VSKKPVKVIARCGLENPPLAAIVVSGLRGVEKVAWQKTKNLTKAELRFTNG